MINFKTSIPVSTEEDQETKKYNSIGNFQEKLDANAIITGAAKYTDDLADKKSLIIKIMRSPHACAKILSINKESALKTYGIVAIYTYKDVPQNRFTLAGQSFPENSAYDRLILDQQLRYVGDAVCIIVGKTERSCIEAMRKIKVEYKIQEPVLDFTKAKDHPTRVHDKDGSFFETAQEIVGYDFDRNLTANFTRTFGEDIDEVFSQCDHIIERTYESQAQAHSMMETYRSYAYLDQWDRLTVISSTQVPFHIKRQLAIALGISPSRIRIIKPRVGGGFGGKQTSVTEIYAAFVTLMTGKPSKIIYTRKETYESTNTRHKIKIKIKMGATKEGKIIAIDMNALSDQGAYGEHSFSTLNLVGEKSLPLYNKYRAVRFHGEAVYTHKVPGAAFRGYGATQGIYALECCVNELAREINIDPVELRLLNIVQEGETTLAYGKEIQSSKLRECILKGQEKSDWKNKYPSYPSKDGSLRSIGMAIAMQGSGIANVDNASAQIKLNETGDYTLFMSDTDCGTGSDTILTQMAAESLGCDIHQITPITADTDTTPYDPGSYASSGTYVTGNAVKIACEDLIEQILVETSIRYEIPREELELIEEIIYRGREEILSVKDLAKQLSRGIDGKMLVGTGNYGSTTSPPPYMAGFAETQIDPLTGEIKVSHYTAVVDCGTVINRNLAIVQTEGGIVQGIGLALYEDVQYDEKGKLRTNSFMDYNLPTRKESPPIEVAFEESYEPTGPYGAKSIGELVMNTPAPAITDAVYNGTGLMFRKLPIKAEQVLLRLAEREGNK